MSRVQSIERAFAVRGALADGPVGVTDVAGRVGLPKSTAARMLASLEREGAVEQVPGETRYRLGPRIVALAAGLRDTRGLVAIARPPPGARGAPGSPAEPLEPFTARTVTDAGELLERLRDVRRDGHAWVREEFAEGITSVAAPVAGADGEVVAAVHVHGPSYRFPRRGTEGAVAGRVLATAAPISAPIPGAPGAGPER